jgi:hypothetical protein
VKFEINTAVSINVTIVSGLTSCRLVKGFTNILEQKTAAIFMVKPGFIFVELLVLTFQKILIIPVTGRGWEMLRIPHCLINRLTGGGKVVGPYAPAALYSTETQFLCF